MKQLIVTKLSPNKMITSNGYLVCSNAILARTGKQQYLKSEIYEDSDDDEIIEVDRKPEQVFADATIASFENVPLTCEHPYENVTPENYKEYSVGYVRDVHKGKFNNQNVLMGTLVVTDPQCIQDIQNGYRTELSCGYDCDISEGKNPQQINIRGNHVALCEQGRAGIAKIMDSFNVNEYYEVNLNDSFKKFASLKGAMEYSRQRMDDSANVNALKIYKIKNGNKSLYKTLVDANSVNDEDLAVGSIYVDQNGQTWQITKVEGDKYVINVDNTTENKISKVVFEKMIGKELKPSQELRDSYIGSCLGRKMYKTPNNKYTALDRKNLIVADSLKELKDAIKDEEEAFQKEVKQEQLNKLAYELEDKFAENDIYPDGGIGASSLIIGGGKLFKLGFEIDGDWKHDHLFADYLVEEWCKEKGFVLIKSTEEVTRDSESDDYGAYHEYFISLDQKKGNDIKHALVGDSSVKMPKSKTKNFLKKLASILNENLDKLSEEEITLDSEVADDYIAQRNRLKRELRNQIKKCSK